MHNLLIVDDMDDMRKFLTDTLGSLFQVKIHEAVSGVEAFDLLRLVEIDFVVSDLYMTNGDGVWLLNQMRRQDMRIPVILFSSTPEELLAEIPLTYPLKAAVNKFRFANLVENLEIFGLSRKESRLGAFFDKKCSPG